MYFNLVRYSGYIRLLHLTSMDRLNNILEQGLFASEYGDLPVGNNDGAGIYAIRPDKKTAVVLAQQLFPGYDNNEVYGISFDYNGEYYECTDAISGSIDPEEAADFLIILDI